MNYLSTTELLKEISQKKIYIYGAGFVAKRFFEILINKGYEKNICGFITTKKEIEKLCNKSVEVFNEIKNSLDDDILICVAVYEVGYKQIKELLALNNISNYTWIYPNIHELCLGEKIEENKLISVTRLLRRYLNDYAIPIRYLAIGQYFGENNVGYDLYLKGMRLHCNNDTAKDRLLKFMKLIQDWKDDGYNNTTIKVTDEDDIIDGAHRLALALYFGVTDLYCDVYSGENYKKFISDSVRISEEETGIFTRKELRCLDELRGDLKSLIDKE